MLAYIQRSVIITSLLICHSNSGMMPGQNFGPSMNMPGLPSGPNFAPPASQQGNGGMHMPSDAELEAMFREIEKIAAENPEIIKEWEREGQRAIMAMSDAELNEFSQLMGLDPAQLRAEAAQALAGEPITQEAHHEPIRPEQPSKKPSETTEKPAIKASKSDIDTLQRMIRELIHDLVRLQQAANSVRDVHEMVRAWSQELRELMFYLRVIDSDEHYSQLAAPEFKNLLKTLTRLQKDLSSEISNIILPDDLSHETTAYDLLGLIPHASEKEINAAYEALSRKHNPKKLEQELRAAGKSEENIKRLVKAARINFEAIEEAYEQLSDEKLRKQLNRTIQAQQQLQQQKIEHALTALQAIKASFSNAVYTQQLLHDLERFLKTYAPQQAALKKQIEEAEKKRKEDQKKKEGMRAQETPGRYEQSVSYGRPSYDYGYSDFPNRYSSDSDWNRHRPDFDYGSKEEALKKPETGAPLKTEQKPGEKPKDEKEKGKEEKPKDSSSSKEAEEKQAAQKKSENIDKRPIGYIVTDIEKNLKEFEKQYGAATENTISKNNLRDFETYAQEKSITREIKPAQYGKTRLMTDEELAYTPEELSQKNLVEDKPQAKQRTVKEIIQKAVTEELPSAVRPDISNKLQDIEKTLKIDALAKDFENLDKKMKIEKIKKFDTGGESVWKKITELHKKQKKTLDKLAKQISKAYEGMSPEKQEAHEEAIEKLLKDIKIISDGVTNINKKFEE